jgi:hypothetical protein
MTIANQVYSGANMQFASYNNNVDSTCSSKFTTSSFAGGKKPTKTQSKTLVKKTKSSKKNK